MLRSWLAVLALLLGINFCFAAESNVPLTSDKRWDQARKSLAEGKPDEAKTLFEELLKQYPTAADLHLFLGIAQLRLRNPDAAIVAVKRAIGEDPRHVEARTLLGWIEMEVRGNVAAAITEYEKVIELRPELPEAYSNLAAAQKKSGELDRAVDRLATRLLMTFPECLTKTIESMRKKKLEHWDRNKETNRAWLALNMMTEARVGFRAFMSGGGREIDFVALRKLIADGVTWDDPRLRDLAPPAGGAK